MFKKFLFIICVLCAGIISCNNIDSDNSGLLLAASGRSSSTISYGSLKVSSDDSVSRKLVASEVTHARVSLTGCDENPPDQIVDVTDGIGNISFEHVQAGKNRVIMIQGLKKVDDDYLEMMDAELYAVTDIEPNEVKKITVNRSSSRAGKLFYQLRKNPSFEIEKYAATAFDPYIPQDEELDLIDYDSLVQDAITGSLTTSKSYKLDESWRENKHVTILIEKYLGKPSVSYKLCSNSNYKDGKLNKYTVSEDGKDYVFTFENTSSVTLTKVTAGNNSYSIEYKIKKPGVYRAGWEKANDGDDVWTNDKRNFIIMRTVVVTGYIEQKDNHQMYLAHYQHDDETQELCDLSRTAYWDSVPCGTELSENAGLKKDGNGFWVRKFRVAEGKKWKLNPTLGAWGSEAYLKGTCNKYDKAPCAAAAEGGTLTLYAKDYTFFPTPDGTEYSCTRAALLTYVTDKDTGKTVPRLVWHGGSEITWGKDGESGETKIALRDKINGKENGYYYDFKNLTAGEKYFFILKNVDGSLSGKKQYFIAPLDETTEKFCFAVCGDSQSSASIINENLPPMMKQGPEFVLSVGDISNDGNKPKEQWETMFFKPIVANLKNTKSSSAGYNCLVPFNAAPGNHDRTNSLFADYLGLDKRYNAFSYGNALFLTLDVEMEFSPGSEQYEWIENTLKNDTHRWKIVAVHESPYCYAPRHYANYRVRKYLHPLFAKYGVNVVFAGHIHVYNHPKAKDGVEYINLPAMGAKSPTVTNEAPIVTETMFEGEGAEGQVSVPGKTGFAMVYATSTKLYVKVMDKNKSLLEPQFEISAR